MQKSECKNTCECKKLNASFALNCKRKLRNVETHVVLVGTVSLGTAQLLSIETGNDV